MREGRKKAGRYPETGLLLVILVSIGYIMLLAGGNPEVFLIDDNRTQWYPVMERAYEDFWTTGRIYCYDFYQMKGMSVAGQGYYGVMNPFILLSYTVTRLLPGGIDAITFYIGLMVVLGNFFLYLTCRRFGCKQVSAFLLTMTYSTMGCFWAFFYWYYVFNNYFLVPLLVYVFLHCMQGGSYMYCACGVVLAMDLWMGNVQYTFYHYILFGLLCLMMIILKNERYFIALCSNLMVGGALSLPMLCLLLQASGGFQHHEDFMKYPLLYFDLLIHSMIPQGVLWRHGRGFSFLNSHVMGRDDNLVCYMGIVGILLFAILLWTVGRFLRRAGEVGRFGGFLGELRTGYDKALVWSHEEKTAAGCAVALFFFMSLMSGGAAAHIFGVIPVVSNFRYLFKAIFPASPLAVLLLAYLVGTVDSKSKAGRCENSVPSCESIAEKQKSKVCDDKNKSDRYENKVGLRLRTGAAVFAVVFVCIGTVNAGDTIAFGRQLFGMQVEGSSEEEKEIALSAIAAAGMDGKNYRTTAFFQFSGVNDECFALPHNLTKNFATAINVFSLAGYEIATEETRLEMFDAVYSDTDFYTTYANADTLENFCHNLQRQPKIVQKQLIENSVRYLLLDRTTLEENRLAKECGGFFFQNDRREEVVAALQALPDVCVERVCAFNDYYDLVELTGTNSLCMDGEGRMIPLTDENMQTLSFDAQAAQDYTLSFAWDRRLRASVAEKDGTVRPLPVEETENGNIRISTEGSDGGRVTLTWHDPLCTAGFVWEGLATLVFLCLLMKLSFHKTENL